jgi:hypothetical protein
MRDGDAREAFWREGFHDLQIRASFFGHIKTVADIRAMNTNKRLVALWNYCALRMCMLIHNDVVASDIVRARLAVQMASLAVRKASIAEKHKMCVKAIVKLTKDALTLSAAHGAKSLCFLCAVTSSSVKRWAKTTKMIRLASTLTARRITVSEWRLFMAPARHQEDRYQDAVNKAQGFSWSSWLRESAALLKVHGNDIVSYTAVYPGMM